MLPLILPLLSTASGATDIRVVTWNIESVGDPDSEEYAAALAVLARIDADIVALNEIAGKADAENLAEFAKDAGYDWVHGADRTPQFGYQRNAIISRIPIIDTQTISSDDLSGDIGSKDMCRYIERATMEIEDTGETITVVVSHWKSGVNNSNEFRRLVTSRRIAAAVDDLDTATDSYIIVGDMNAEADRIEAPALFSELPTGLPSTYSLGSDLADELAAWSFANNPFSPLRSAGLTVLDALQLSGEDGTRPSSGYRLDYVWASDAIETQGVTTEIFNTEDGDLDGSIATSGEALDATVSMLASDHLPIIADITIGAAAIYPEDDGPDALTVTDLQAGDLVVSELMFDPGSCSDRYGEWIEVYNAAGQMIDLDGLVISDAGGSQGTIDGSVLLDAGGFAVLGRSDASRWCGAVTVDGHYGASVSLNNSGDSITLLAGNTTIDATPTLVDSTTDTAWQLDPAWLDGTGNDDLSRWCEEIGSAGAENAACTE